MSTDLHTTTPDPLAGTARLAIVVPVALVSFFYAGMLDYSLPLYVTAREALAGSGGAVFSKAVWVELMTWRLTPWIVGPMLAGLLARWYGERKVWCAALIGKLIVPLGLTMHPSEFGIFALAIWQGLTGALMWISGISLIQMVAPHRKGLSNGLMFTAMGVGSVMGPLCGRLILFRRQLGNPFSSGDWVTWSRRLFNFDPIESTPRLPDFELLFWILAVTTTLCGIAVGLWGQRPGRFQRDEPPSLSGVVQDLKLLARTPSFLALVAALCLFGGPVFGASNFYLKYRAEDMGFITDGGGDAGWIWLVLLKTLMWVLGGAAVGLIAGRRASGLAGVLMIGSFSLAATGIAASQLAWQLFATVALFEFTRQFMRWSHGGYMTEHLQARLRPTAIGFAITFSGTGEVLYGWLTMLAWDPEQPGYESWKPILVAGILGLMATAGLFAFDRLRPIRAPVDPNQPQPEPPVAPAESSA